VRSLAVVAVLLSALHSCHCYAGRAAIVSASCTVPVAIPRRALKLRGDVRVGPVRGLLPVPGPVVGIVAGVGDLGQRPVHVLPLARRRRPVGRPAHERMTECHPGAELDQPVPGRRRRCLGTDPQQAGCPSHQARVADRIGRGDQQQPAALVPKSQHPAAGSCPRPAPRPVPRRGTRTRPPAPPGSILWAAPAAPTGSPGLGDDPVPDPRIQWPGQHRIQQRPRVLGPQALDYERRQPRHMAGRLARREDQAHRLCVQARAANPSARAGASSSQRW